MHNDTSLYQRAIHSKAPAATLLIRVMVGGIFLSEGIQKFLDPVARGGGRFSKIGIPWPDVMGNLVGGVEVVCGLLLLVGLLTRFAAVPLITTMAVAIVTTKIPILLGHGFWGLGLKTLSTYGFWSMAHEARTDFSMLLGSVFLLLLGSGPLALERRLRKPRPLTP